MYQFLELAAVATVTNFSAHKEEIVGVLSRVRGQVADRQQMLHQLFSSFTIVPTPWTVRSSISRE